MEMDDFDHEDDTMPCPYCRRVIHQETVCCPHCGNYLSEEDVERPLEVKPWWMIVGAVVCLLVVIGWILGG